MPKLHKPRRTYRRKPQTSSWGSKALQVAKVAWKGVKFLKGIINSEKKAFDTSFSSAAVDYNGTITPITAIAQGDAINNRSGNSILAKSCKLNYSIFSPTFNASNSATARVMLVQDMMNLGTIPSVSDILISVGSSNAPISQLNRANSQQYRFKILYDKLHVFSSTGGIRSSIMQNVMINDHVKFTGTATTDEGKGFMYLVIISDQVTTNLINVTGTTRVFYYDN